MSPEAQTTTVRSKKSTLKWAGIVVLAAAVIGGAWFAVKWFADPSLTSVPLKASDSILQKEISELESEVRKLDTQAREAARKVADDALKDDYLSIQEEKETPARSLKEAESIKSLAVYPAVIAGFVFEKENGQKHSVSGFSFDDNLAREILESEFKVRSTAVKERELIEQLRGMLRQNTQGDQRLDDDERSAVLGSITGPKAGKKAGLNRAVALSTIEGYCRSNGIQTGPKAN